MEVDRFRCRNAHGEGGNKRTAERLILLVFVLFFLWDYYLQEYGIRPFDLLGWLIMGAGLCVIAMMPGISRVFQPRNSQLVCVFSFPFLTGAFRGAVQGNIKTSLAILAGLVVFAVYYAVRLDRHRLYTLTNWLLIVQASALLVQEAYFKVSGEVVNYHMLTGLQQPRVYHEDLNWLRPSGLFLEPNSYAIATFMLLLIKFRLSRTRDWISYLALASLAISESLWGLVCVALLLLTPLAHYFIRIVTVIILAFVILYADDIAIEKATLVGMSEVTLDRIRNLENDSSTQDRYLTFLNLGDALATAELWLGAGVSAYGFQSYGGANAYSYIIYGYGVCGAAAMLVAFFGLAERGHRALCLFGILFGMTTFPLWSYFYWWSWLGLMAKRYEGDAIKTRSSRFP